MSDKWKAYNQIKQRLGFERKSVNHSLSFVAPKEPDKEENAEKTHTNGIERIWKDAKMQVKRMTGIARGHI